MTDPKTGEKDYLGHRKRLRDRFLKAGPESLSDYEIIELLLTFAIPRRDTKPIAKKLIKEFKTIQGVFEASREDLMSVSGVGENAAFLIKFILEASSYYLRDKITKKEYLHSAKDVLRYLQVSMKGLKHEIFKVIFLNSRNEIIHTETLHEGTLNQSIVYPRKIIEKAIRYNASGLIFVHNHPSGHPKPSSQDKEITRNLVFAARMMDMDVYDHIIIGENDYYSFAENGDIKHFKEKYLILKGG
ncbi:MAG: DNA repair protein RadC [Deltaproteobacteria bacterium]|uniref:DNA repair protein RadC n=1 Tax=Candidatus Zymogenus saltonus TaxID=2844893 RepID=A0A9D8KF82_9DELT|nr:DNA repair protein RadC [Candidatus Zymogenus saltonus]